MFKGFSPHLQSARDLLDKLNRDYERMVHDPSDPDAAFDFFVTAEHMPEWLYLGHTARANRLRRRVALLRVVSHLASGAKHFEARAPHHGSVRDVNRTNGAFQGGAFQADVFDVGRVVLELTGPEAHKYGRRIGALKLAEHVLSFWARRIK